MKRMIWMVSVQVVLCLIFFGCATADAGLDEAAGARGQHPVSNIPVLRELIEETNRLDEEMAQMGFYALRTTLFMKYVEPEEPYAAMDESRMLVQDDCVDLTLAARIEEGDFDGSTAFSVVALLTINGRMVDFEMDGSRSENGLLCAELQSNRDYLLPLHADHLPVAEGENELMLIMMSCCPAQELYLDAQSLTCSFHSDLAYEGASVELCPEEQIDRVITVRDKKDAPELMARPTVAAGEQLDFESDHRGHYLIRTKPAPTLHFYIDNMSMEDLYGQRAGLMALFVDGQLQPVWDGRRIAEIRLQETDMMKVIQLKTDFGSGERHNVCWYYLETESADEWKALDRYAITVETR